LPTALGDGVNEHDRATAESAKKKLLFNVKSRFEVNPGVGGYLRSLFDKLRTWRKIEKGTKLGEMIDIHTLEVAEELRHR